MEYSHLLSPMRDCTTWSKVHLTVRMSHGLPLGHHLTFRTTSLSTASKSKKDSIPTLLGQDCWHWRFLFWWEFTYRKVGVAKKAKNIQYPDENFLHRHFFSKGQKKTWLQWSMMCFQVKVREWCWWISEFPLLSLLSRAHRHHDNIPISLDTLVPFLVLHLPFLLRTARELVVSPFGADVAAVVVVEGDAGGDRCDCRGRWGGGSSRGCGGGDCLAEQEPSAATDEAATPAPAVLHPSAFPFTFSVVML